MIRQTTGFLKWLSSVAAVIAVACVTLGLNDAVQALVINGNPSGTSNPAPYNASPTGINFGGHDAWDYVGQTGNGTGVYVGNGWVLTAGHVTQGATITFGSSSTPYSFTGTVQNLTGSPDLILRKISGDPGLQPLPISSSHVSTTGGDVVMIATGQYRVSSRQDYLVGTPSELLRGYWADPDNPATRGEAWGTNTVYQATTLGTSNGHNTYLFSTRFDNVTGDAQAMNHDSGGAVFMQDGLGQWELAGLILGVDNIYVDSNNGKWIAGYSTSGTNSATTSLADLSYYRSDIVQIPEPASLALLCLGSLTLLRRRHA